MTKVLRRHPPVLERNDFLVGASITTLKGKKLIEELNESNAEIARPVGSPQPKQKKKVKRYQIPYGMDSYGRMQRFHDLADLPAVELDDNGFPVRPMPISSRHRAKLGELERKARFLLAYNYSCGNITVACQESGAKREQYAEWTKTDPVFRAKIERAKIEIGDRSYYRLCCQMGLIRSESVHCNESALTSFVRKCKPELFDSEPNEQPVPEQELPRPTYEVRPEASQV